MKPHGRYCVPAAPIAQLVTEWINRHAYDHVTAGVQRLKGETAPLTPVEILALRTGYKDVYRNLHRLVHESRNVTLEVADKWLTAIDRIDAWHTHPELTGVYERGWRTESETAVTMEAA